MSTALQDRVILVTGASGGVGRAVAIVLAANGARVIVTGRRRDALEALERAGGGRVRMVVADLAVPAAIDGLIDALGNETIDGLINNAGHDAGGNVAFATEDTTAWNDKVAVNLVAAMRLTHALLPGLLTRPRADIVMIGSVVTRTPAAGLTAYSATKHGLHGFVQGLRADYAATPLRITEIIPAVIRSGFAERRWAGDSTRSDAFYAKFPGCLTPEDVARAVLFALEQPPDMTIDEIVLGPARRAG